MSRPLAIVADDYGIGPETSRGILELASEGCITATVMIVNTAFAESAVQDWQRVKPDADLGWHPNLTLDFPLSPPDKVPSLVRADGSFWPLGTFLRRVILGRIRSSEVFCELKAQYGRFIDLVGRPPSVVNSHQHVSLFPPVDAALFEILKEGNHRPYLRRVVESSYVLARIPGARVKRTVLSMLGRRVSRRARKEGFPGCDRLAGVTDHACVADERFFTRWIRALSSSGSVEVCCHPGYRDETLVGRDCDAGDGLLRRTREFDLLRSPDFKAACKLADLAPLKPSALMNC